jgi:hypothetical protein
MNQVELGRTMKYGYQANLGGMELSNLYLILKMLTD